MAVPPNTPRSEAMKILLEFEGGNTHGTGAVCVKNGKFVFQKFPSDLSGLLAKGTPYMKWLPYAEGWTMAHLRLASHGAQTVENTHPFIIGSGKDAIAVVHNGVWSDYSVAKIVLNKEKWQGETDTEVAAEVIYRIGMKKFCSEFSFGGVFMSLNLKGELEIAKVASYGDLMCHVRPDKSNILASKLDKKDYPEAFEVKTGYWKFDKNGHVIDSEVKKNETSYGGFGGHYQGRTRIVYSGASTGNSFNEIRKVTTAEALGVGAMSSEVNDPDFEKWWMEHAD